VISVSGNGNDEAHGEGGVCLLISISYCFLHRPVWQQRWLWRRVFGLIALGARSSFRAWAK